MNYDRHRRRWPGLILYLIYVSGVVYLLMANNRFLYSHLELRSALAGEQSEAAKPVGPSANSTQELGEATHWNRANPERTGHDLSPSGRDREYVPEWQKILLEDGHEGEIDSWAADSSGIYVAGNGPWIWAFNSDGDLKWRFRLSASTKSALAPSLDQANVYFASPSGEVLALNKNTGALVWRIRPAEEILSGPVIIRDEIWAVVRPLSSELRRLDKLNEGLANLSKKSLGPTTHRMLRLMRKTGEVAGYTEAFGVKGITLVTWAREVKQIIVTSENRLQLINDEDGKLGIGQTLPDPIVGPALYAEGKIFVGLSSGKIQAWDLAKKAGKFEWEVGLDSPPAGPLTFLPAYQRLALITTDGHLHMVDVKKAEHLWRFPLENRSSSREIWAGRLSGKHIEKLSMKWEKKGWTAWAPCSENRICIYNPDKGQLVARISAVGDVLSPPLFVGKSFYLVTAEKKPEGLRRFRLTHYLDEDSFKKKAKSAGEAAQTQGSGKEKAL